MRLPGIKVRERWSKPPNILDVSESLALIEMPDGREMVDVQIAVDDETIQRLREGRICANCMEPLEQPFPEICHALKLPNGEVVGCFYRVRDRQIEDLASRYGSMEEVHIGSRINMADEAERLRELDAYEERTGIRLPDSVKFPTTTIPGR